MKRADFRGDLKTGLAGEQRVVDLFRGHGLDAGFREAGDRSDSDVFVRATRKTLSVEVKFDLYEARSGNVAVEWFNPKSGKPSGLKATKADLWCFVLGDRSVWFARTQDLDRAFDKGEEGPGFQRRLHQCGDGNAAAVLYRRGELFDHCFFRLDDAGREDVLATVEMFSL